MPELDLKQQNFISRVVEKTPQVLNILSDLDGLWLEWNANQYASGVANAITDDDFVGANAHLDAEALNALMYVYGLMVQSVDGTQRATMWRSVP